MTCFITAWFTAPGSHIRAFRSALTQPGMEVDGAKCSSTSPRSVPSCPHTALCCCLPPAILIPPEAGDELPELLLKALHAPQDKVLPAYKLPPLLLHCFSFPTALGKKGWKMQQQPKPCEKTSWKIFLKPKHLRCEECSRLAAPYGNFQLLAFRSRFFNLCMDIQAGALIT